MNVENNSTPRNNLLPLLDEFRELLSPLKGATVTIIGGGGFVGLWLCEAISALNDLYSFKTSIQLHTLTGKFLSTFAPHLAERPDIKVVLQDCRRTTFNQATQYIIHAASPINKQQSEPIHTASIIAEGTRSTLEAARLLPNIRNILYLSSGTVYGPQPFEIENLSENMFQKIDPSVLGNSFAESKRFTESLCAAYRNEARIPLVIARPFAFLGPYQLPSIPWALHSFISDAMQSRPIRILGDGQSVRSYLYGSDMALWLLALVARGQNGTVYNVGSPESLTLLEAAEMVSQYFNNKIEITRLAQGAHLKKTRFVPDTTKLQNEFGFKITTKPKAAIAQTIDWMLRQPKK